MNISSMKVWSAAVAISAGFAFGGMPIVNSCYQMSKAADLEELRTIALSNKGICVELTQDIVVNTNVLNEQGTLNTNHQGEFVKWTPISEFQGQFDGKGFAIKGLYSNIDDFEESSIYMGLFADVAGTTTIQNLGIVDSYFNGIPSGSSSKTSNVGAFVATVKSPKNNQNPSRLRIDNCYTNSFVSSNTYVSGFVGTSYYKTVSIIMNSYNEGVVLLDPPGNDAYSNSAAGAFYGTGYYSTVGIFNSYNVGPINANNGFAGAFVGEGHPFILNSYNKGTLAGDNVNPLVGKEYGNYENVYTYDVVDAAGAIQIGEKEFSNGSLAFVLNDYNPSPMYESVLNSFGASIQDKKSWGQNVTKGEKYPGLGGSVIGETVNSYNVQYVTYEGDGQVGSYPSKYVEGFEFVLPEYNERTGHIFLGWYDSRESSASRLKSIAGTEKGNKVVYAKYLKISEPEKVGECYQISSKEDLYSFAAIVNGTFGMTQNRKACGELTQDIVLNENVLNADGSLNGRVSDYTLWESIGLYNYDEKTGAPNHLPFVGTFNGNGHAVLGLVIIGGVDNGGLFGLVGEEGESVVIQNLEVTDSYSESSGCVVNDAQAGKLEMKNVHSGCTIKNKFGTAGGLVSSVGGALKITNSFNTGSITAETYVGGLIGGYYDGTSVTIEGSYNAGNLSSERGTIGGLVGAVDTFDATTEMSLRISKSYNVGDVVGSSDYAENVGGLVGAAYGVASIYIEDSYNTAAISGAFGIGGLIGYVEAGDVGASASILRSYNTGDVAGNTYVGGLLGFIGWDEAALSVENCYNVGNVVAVGEEGAYWSGLVGIAYCKSVAIKNSFFGGKIQANGEFSLLMINEKSDEKGIQNSYVLYEGNDKEHDCENLNCISKSELSNGILASVLHDVDPVWGQVIERDAYPTLVGGFYFPITYHLNGGSFGAVAVQDYYDPTVDNELLIPTRVGYTFSDWYVDAEFSGDPVKIIPAESDGMREFYAKWEKEAEEDPVEEIGSSDSQGKDPSSVASSDDKSSSSSGKTDKPAGSSSSNDDADKKSSSSSGKDAIYAVTSQSGFQLSVHERNLQISGVRAGSAYALIDMQGRVLLQGRASAANINVAVPQSGRYLLRVGSAVKSVSVK